MIGPDNIIDSLNEELLKCTGEQEEKKDEKVAKRNSKQDIINKCIKVAEDTGIPLQYSDTKLNRMTKQELNKLLAANIEAGMQQQMAEQVGVQKNASEKLIALGALRMIHNLAANATEQGINAFLPRYGYEVNGFSATLDAEPVKEAVDACLEEIARESDILGYIESPFARLGIAWSGALVTCLRPHQKNNALRKRENASQLGSKPSRKQNPV
jgi:hypothetical protein